MKARPSARSRFAVSILGAGLAVLAGCAAPQQSATQMPFHLAILPPVSVAEAASNELEGTETELQLAFDGAALGEEIAAALRGGFCKVTLLPRPANGKADPDPEEWVAAAQRVGADVVLQPTLAYDPRIQTSLNDRFWLNLPLFALGGPFGWFVSDRSYYCNARLGAEVFDVTAAAASPGRVLDATSRVLRIDRESTEASLNFLDRASGVGPYLLSIVCPAGLIARSSDAVPGELGKAVSSQLCSALAQSLADRSVELTNSDLVDFEPRNVHVAENGGRRWLDGEMVLRLGRVDDLVGLRYSIDGGTQAIAQWGKESTEAAVGTRPARKVYPFHIALTPEAKTVRVEVEQRDRRSSKRTFTFPVAVVAPK